MVILGAAPAFSQAKEPDKKPDRHFRYYKPAYVDSLKFFSFPGHPDFSNRSGKMKRDFNFNPRQLERMERDFKFDNRGFEQMERDFNFNNRGLDFHRALPAQRGMPTYRPPLRDKMPVLKPDSTIEYHLRIKPLKGDKAYK